MIRAAGTVVAATALWTAGAHSASADTGGFPDLGAFAPVSADGFTNTVKGYSSVLFSTPYNVRCEFAARPVTNLPSGAPSQLINCAGAVPSMGSCATGAVLSQGDGPAYTVERKADDCGATFSNGTLLNVGQKITVANVTCAVGADQLIACLDTNSGNHGFVLQPSGSWGF